MGIKTDGLLENFLKQYRAGVYIRVSTHEQAEHGFSLEGQDEHTEKYADLFNMEIVEKYIDSGISGKSMEARPALQRMIRDVKDGKLDKIITWKVSRIARNNRDLLNLLKILNDHEVALISISEGIDTSSMMGKMMLQFLGIMAEFERYTIIENVKMGMERRTKLGLKNGGRMLGYRSVGEGRESKLVIDEREAEIVSLIFKLYISGKGYKAIANDLNKKGHKTVKGNNFSITAVKGILENPTYIGKIRYNQYVDYANKRRKGKNDDVLLVDGVHEAIIDEITWNQARYIQSKKTKNSTKNTGKYPLTGILRCPECGYGMVAAGTTNKLKDGTSKRIRYYSCGQFHNKGSAVCHANSVRAEYAEAYVFEQVSQFLNNDGLIKKIVKKLNHDRKAGIAPMFKKRDRIEREISKAAERKKKDILLYEDGILSKQDIMGRIEAVDSEIESMIGELDEVKQELVLFNHCDVPVEQVQNIFANLAELLVSADAIERQRLLKLIVDKITVKDKKIENIHIEYNPIIQGMMDEMNEEEGEISTMETSPSFYEFRAVI
ncbi:site-specific DNA recombinase (modular protein) [Acetoanaerobium sticklandii]|uniref:Site-specific DNA recombinase (Modular protein) n=1 Tax=Acetoanaerobium sticklandii (strain ATCC 12662 / DSM 519 / JCM 1433 / CCUG 9281 / NCIMB 10654 / HF) TaxID=499177 RepID=E3PVS9_ACESD|nr:recombinase family protein [Acetoanaerobium sticklandii]CBH22632.1 site-specific DNA recombinase (modular protein) [Acetoanaerobium sticklandii]